MVQNEHLSVGKTLVSYGQTFEFGFFSTNNTKELYLGIWYKNVTPTAAVWVANRNHPLTDSAGDFTIANDGNIVLLNGSKIVIWSSNLSMSVVNPVVQLLESGNLVLKDDPERYIWKSFDYPTDTRLPDMKLGWDLKLDLNRYLTSWKNASNPSIGDYSYGVDLVGLPQFVLRSGSRINFRSRVWNGVQFSGIQNLRSKEIFSYTVVIDTDEVYGTLVNKGGDPSQNMKWSYMSVLPRDQCDSYNHCGVNGVRNIAITSVCVCLQGFTALSPQQWSIFNWTDGCVRKTSLECGSDIFVQIQGLKLPDMIKISVNKSTSLEECGSECKRNCSCTAYANSDVREGGSGCILWFDDLFDFRHFSEAPNGQALFLRLASTEGETINKAMNEKSRMLMKVLLSVGLAVLFFSLVVLIIWKTRRMGGVLDADERQNEDLELPLFDLITLETATNNFSHTNKIGEGGYGPVYKGKTLEGQEIAVKRLSKDSGQGNTELKNEVILIAKLQHRNLVKLLGCCIQAEEKILIYEYMPNASLDYFIFGQKRSKLMGWDMRLSIVMDIAKGLLYLHQDSSLRIVHRDLKATKTERLAGTYGYMSPEYAVDGHFSVNSDVFSFGVLVLEIMSGKKNRGFYHDNHHHNLLGHAWILWNEGDPCELMEPGLGDSNSASCQEVLRCIQVGLLCVQKLSEDRPCMSAVVFMLSSENSLLLEPKQPGFFIERGLDDHANTNPRFSENQVTISLEAR
ncbi:hypothetical protein MKW98_026688 [Papaver atlanticum]|uniref:Receptor-like serine/threonine-protein kinase n=1 Tax=Papaver atlanticum TaxID=357466 RepID=A0AAD4RZN6_9MAGN|nr:hypothetical protein MKW98_026688 [Papaver atlanticum]